jgi:hypothetical protein
MRKDPQVSTRTMAGLNAAEQNALQALARLCSQPPEMLGDLPAAPSLAEIHARQEFRRIKAELRTNFEK